MAPSLENEICPINPVASTWMTVINPKNDVVPAFSAATAEGSCVEVGVDKL